MVNCKPFAFIQSFFQLMETILEIKCRPTFKRRTLFLLVETIFSDFCRYSCEWKHIFPASGNGVFIKSFMRTSAYGFWVNFKPCAFIQSFFFLLLESITEIRCKPVFFDFFLVSNSGGSFSG